MRNRTAPIMRGGIVRTATLMARYVDPQTIHTVTSAAQTDFTLAERPLSGGAAASRAARMRL